MVYIYYDKQCSFCSGFTNGIEELQDQKNIIIKDSADLELYQSGEKIDTMVVIRNNQKLIYSDAALELMVLAGRKYSFFVRVARLFPRQFRDSIYRIVAKNRNNFLGKQVAV
jgi:predicted DCC family thiol-disulfide oxidoreductase YuxK